MKVCPYCEDEKIEDEDYACFSCNYELMSGIERENLGE